MSIPRPQSQPMNLASIPSKEIITAALPPGMSLQDVAVCLASGVCEAYAAYNNGSNLQPVLSGYHAFHPIYVWESDPNLNPFADGKWEAYLNSVNSKGQQHISPRQPAAYVSLAGAALPSCTGPIPMGEPSIGSQLFGFTATADDHSHNILVFRGTVTMQEAGYDLLGWGNNTQCLLPSQGQSQKNDYGFVNSYLFDFYLNDDDGLVTSLAASCMSAIRATVSHKPAVPWFVGGHSLGGPMASLAALDAVVSNVFSDPKNTFVFTFGSLHVGDQSFANAYTQQVPLSVRIANLCDFVPSMVSLEPVTLTDPYVHVGAEATFVWQTWDDWGNHSLANIYQPMVQSHWDVIQWGSRKYPQ